MVYIYYYTYTPYGGSSRYGLYGDYGPYGNYRPILVLPNPRIDPWRTNKWTEGKTMPLDDLVQAMDSMWEWKYAHTKSKYAIQT